MEKYNEEDIIKETKKYLFFNYGVYNKSYCIFLNVMKSKKYGLYSLYKDYDNPQSKKRLKYLIKEMNDNLQYLNKYR
tara:strand:+ start:132 stop:362 length:231 start_codon:yes stop_codon:yes gene_type:complete